MAQRIWAGLDVGVETTSLCVIDSAGQVMQEAICPTTLQAIHREIRWLRRRRHARVGLEASGTSALARGLRTLGYSIDLYETRTLSKFLRVRRNKTDAGDAIGIAEAGRIGASLVSKVYLKSLECQSLQSRLVIRRRLIRERVSASHLLRRQFESYGVRLRKPAKSAHLRAEVESHIRVLFGKAPTPLGTALLHLLDHCERLLAHQRTVDRELEAWCWENELCRRFMAIPGVGPICATNFYAAVGEPHRFKRSTDIGSYLGLTPRLHQSGLTSRVGRISKMGHGSARSALVHAAMIFMRRSNSASAVWIWAARLAQSRGGGRARVALARKLAVIMLTMWKSNEVYTPVEVLIPDVEYKSIGPRAPKCAGQRENRNEADSKAGDTTAEEASS
jgi:transposase